MAATRLGSGITLILIPQANRRSVSLRLPVALLLIASTALLVTAFAVGLYWVRLTDYTETLVRNLQVETSGRQRLTEENLKQRQDLDRMAALAALIEADLEKLRSLDQTIRGMLSNRDPAMDDAMGSGFEAASDDSSLIPSDPDGGIGGGTGGLHSAPGNTSSFETRSRLTARSGIADDRGRTSQLPGDGADLLQSLVALQGETAQRVPAATQAAKDLETHLDFLAHRPTGYPVPGRVTSPFGTRYSPFGYGRQQHDGVDLAADYGDPVLATADGSVVFSGWRAGGYGLAIVIDHGYGFRTLYAHNDELFVQVGDAVRRGQRIADAGSTGDSTGPHVHYEVLLWGQPVDPTPYR